MIHIFYDNEIAFPENQPYWEIWADCEDGGLKDGRCIGSGKTEKEAVEAAMTELGADLAQLRLTWEAL